MGSTIWTIGHSTRPLNAFLELLARYRLEAVADVRRFPGSRRYPRYAEARSALRSPSIASPIAGSLGGRRRRLPPGDDRGCAVRPRYRSSAYPRCEAHRRASLHVTRSHRQGRLSYAPAEGEGSICCAIAACRVA